MSKNIIGSIEWHVECIQNMEESYKRDKEYLALLKRRLDDLGKSIILRQLQVTEAIKQHKSTFDAERFLHKRKKK